MSNKKDKGNEEDSRFIKPEDYVENLQLRPIGISFKDKRGADVECIYNPTKAIGQIARGLYSLRNPKPELHKSLETDLAAVTEKYESKRPTKIDIATIAYGILSARFKEKIDEALFELFLETNILTLRELNKKFPEMFRGIDYTSLRNLVINKSSEKRRQYLAGPKKSNSTRERYDFKTALRTLEFTFLAVMLKPLWRHITDYFEDNDYSADCLNDVKRTEPFKTLSKIYPVPDNLLKKVYKRNATKSTEYQPLAFSLRHASSILNIKKNHTSNEEEDYGLNTLRIRYQEGKKLALEHRFDYNDEILETIFFSKLKSHRGQSS